VGRVGTLLVILAAVALVGAVVWFYLRLMRRIAERRADLDVIAAGRRPLRLDGRVNCFGLQSLGRTQARGNGFLALFTDELVFLQWFPKRDIRIRLDRVIAVDQTSGFLGKTVGRPLLRVVWRDPDRRDVASWWVGDLAGWRAAIDDARPAADCAAAT
jgi:hypothetical protein